MIRVRLIQTILEKIRENDRAINSFKEDDFESEKATEQYDILRGKSKAYNEVLQLLND